MSDLISEVKAALQAATPGPWELAPPSWHKGCHGPDCKQNIYTPNRTVAVAFGAQYRKHTNENPPTAKDSADGILIANSPTWLQQLTESLKEAVKALEWYGDHGVYEISNLDGNYVHHAVLTDGGELARTTLKRIKGENG